MASELLGKIDRLGANYRRLNEGEIPTDLFRNMANLYMTIASQDVIRLSTLRKNLLGVMLKFYRPKSPEHNTQYQFPAIRAEIRQTVQDALKTRYGQARIGMLDFARRLDGNMSLVGMEYGYRRIGLFYMVVTLGLTILGGLVVYYITASTIGNDNGNVGNSSNP